MCEVGFEFLTWNSYSKFLYYGGVHSLSLDDLITSTAINNTVLIQPIDFNQLIWRQAKK
jgi:hypothetical protein